MNITPMTTPKFGALYKSLEDEVKGDQMVATASAGVGVVSSAAASAVGLPYAIMGLGVGSFLEGLLRLMGVKPRGIKPGPKGETDQVKVKAGAIEAGVGTASLSASPASGPFGPFVAGMGGTMVASGLGTIYDGLKGKPETKLPDL